MSGVALTSAMRNNLLSLRRLSSQMDRTQEILSTGKKVNSAVDNASNYYQARSLTNRAADLMELLNSMDQGIRTIEAATVGLEQGAAFLEQATAVATEALTTAKIPAKEWFEARQDVATVVSDWNELKAALDSGITGNIVIYGQIECEDSITLKDGQNLVGVGYFGDFDTEVDKFSALSISNNSGTTSITTINNTIISDLDIFIELGRSGVDNWGIKVCGKTLIKDVNLDVSLSQDTMNFVSAIEISNKGNLEIDGHLNIFMAEGNNISTSGIFVYGEGTVTTIRSGANVNVYGADIALRNHSNKLSGGKIIIESAAKIYTNALTFLHNGYQYDGYPAGYIQIDSGAKIAIQSDNQIKWYELNSDYRDENNSTTTHNTIKTDNITTVLDLSATSAWTLPPDLNELVVADTSDNNRDGLMVAGQNFKDILSEYDTMVADSSYQGVNLLTGGKMDVTFNETRSHRFTVAGQDMSAQALGLTTPEWQTQGDIAQSLSEIAAALNSIRGFQAELGNHYGIIQTRQSFTEALADVLETGADDLVLADMNEASAEYLTLQTRQQLAINSLSLAAQSAQSVLSVF